MDQIPTFNADDPSLCQPLRVQMDGRDYTVARVTPRMLDQIVELSEGLEREDSTLRVSDVLSRQMAVFTGQPAEEFLGCDVRQLTGAIRWIQQELNPFGLPGESSPNIVPLPSR